MQIEIPVIEREIFTSALQRLNAGGIPYVVAGAFCVHFYTGIWRFTKDMDVFAEPQSVPQALAALSGAGFRTWIEAEHWLGKAIKQDCMVDVIFGSGNWVSPIDSIWFQRSLPAVLLDQPIRMAPVEEMIWAKSYIAGRERYDAADICHLIMATEGKFDWQHLLWRFGDHWQLLLTYLNLYAFVYPSHHGDIPDWVLDELIGRLKRERSQPPPKKKVCRGTLLDRFCYNYDVEQLGYIDSRERYALAHGGQRQDVVLERAWAREKLAKGEVYKKDV